MRAKDTQLTTDNAIKHAGQGLNSGFGMMSALSKMIFTRIQQHDRWDRVQDVHEAALARCPPSHRTIRRPHRLWCR